MTNYSFRKQLIVCISLLALFAVYVLINASSVTREAKERYNEVIASQPKKARKDKLQQKHELTKQIRWDVQKMIWISEGSLRRILSLDAKRSEMAMFVDRHSMHFVETFYNASGIVQQELFYKDSNQNEYVLTKEGVLRLRDKQEPLDVPIDSAELVPMQCFRFFEAEKAVYDFEAESLIATDIRFWTYITEGHELCENVKLLVPIATGKASCMTLPKRNDEHEFYAENLKLQIRNERGIW